MSNWAGMREGWDRRLASTRWSARLAVAALLATACLRAAEGVLRVVLPRDAQGTLLALALAPLADLMLLAVTAVLFLTWLSRTLSLAAAWSGTPIRWTRSKAVWSFFIPFVSLYQPYQVVRDLHDQLAPDGVPEPAPRPRMDGAGGYRSVAVEKAPPPRTLPHASIGAWWGLFVAERMLSSFTGESVGVFPRALAIAAALLAVLVVRALQGRLEERHRRVHHASDEELRGLGSRRLTLSLTVARSAGSSWRTFRFPRPPSTKLERPSLARRMRPWRSATPPTDRSTLP